MQVRARTVTAEARALAQMNLQRARNQEIALAALRSCIILIDHSLQKTKRRNPKRRRRTRKKTKPPKKRKLKRKESKVATRNALKVHKST